MPKTDTGRFFVLCPMDRNSAKTRKNRDFAYRKRANIWVNTKQTIDIILWFTWLRRLYCGDGGSRTLVQTRNPHGFYMLIPLLVFVPCKGTNALNATLSPKASPCCRSADKAIPKLLSTPGSGRNQESPPAGCLVRPPCERIKPVIYCASIRQRERSCFRQLLFCSQDLRASLRGSACLHDNSSCCQNHTSPFL